MQWTPTDPQRYAKYEFAREHRRAAEGGGPRPPFREAGAGRRAQDAGGPAQALLPDPVKAKVVAEIDKDLTRVPLRDLPKHLEAVLKLCERHNSGSASSRARPEQIGEQAVHVAALDDRRELRAARPAGSPPR